MRNSDDDSYVRHHHCQCAVWLPIQKHCCYSSCRSLSRIGELPRNGSQRLILISPQVNAFDAAHLQGVGIWLPDRANVLDVCQQLTASLGAQLTMTSTGKMRIVKIDLTAPVASTTINPWDYEHSSFTVSERSEVVSGINLGYCKNWTAQGIA